MISIYTTWPKTQVVPKILDSDELKNFKINIAIKNLNDFFIIPFIILL